MQLGGFTIAEPMTLLTDYVLGALAVVFGRQLLSMSEARPIRAWGWAFIALAAGAFAGGTAHGFAHYLDPLGKTLTWKITVYSIGVAVFFMFAGTARAALSRATARWVVALAGLKLAAYLAWMTTHDDFRYVVYDYVPTMLAVLALGMWIARRLGNPAGNRLALGVLVSLAGAGIQLSEIRLHQHFNANDLYHVVQMFGLWLFYHGARGLNSRD